MSDEEKAFLELTALHGRRIALQLIARLQTVMKELRKVRPSQ
jgi:hypothetical protein